MVFEEPSRNGESQLRRVLIAVCTHARALGLERALSSLRSDAPGVDLIVVDNSVQPDAIAAALAAAHDARYLHEPTPGIAPARNRALTYALTEGYTDLAFIDDDERVEPGWFACLLATRERYQANVVNGPVIPDLGTDPAWWVAKSRVFERPRAATGTPTRWPATNNVLIDLESVGDERFPISYSQTGGSDTAFFAALARRGATFVWCDEAVVHEDIPANRQQLKWVWRRGVRLGNVAARSRIDAGGKRSTIALLGFGRLIASPFLIVLDLVRYAQVRPLTWMHLPKAVGMIGATMGRLHVEYAR